MIPLPDARSGGFVALSMPLLMTPGPDMALVTRTVLTVTWRRVLYTVLGVGTGIACWTVLRDVGVGALLERSVLAFAILQLLGVVYLTVLGA